MVCPFNLPALVDRVDKVKSSSVVSNAERIIAAAGRWEPTRGVAMQKIMQGIVHGRTIELQGDPEVEDGSQVEIVLRMKRLPGPPPAWKSRSEQTAAGMMADHWTEEDDRILDEIYQDRKRDTRQEPEA
jgi:hypothetical protein